MKSKSISADPKSSNFLVSSDKKFEIYSVNSKDAVFSHLGAKSIAACLYSKNNSSQILFMNVRKEIEIIDPAGKFEKQNQKNVNVAAKSAMFSDIYGKMIQTSKKTVTSSHTSKLFPFMDISSNVLPSPSVLLLPFLDRMLEKNDKVEEELVEVVVENKENVTIEKVQKKDLKPVANLRLLMKNIYQ